jgi:antitoxin component HigA of HigAB toxin-antitoxin module
MTTDTTAETTTPSNDSGEPTTENPVTTPATTDAATTQPAETKAPEAAAPESYEFKMPDGVQLDKTAADEFTAIAKELKLDQAMAQKVADVGTKMAQRQITDHAKRVETWLEEAKTDKEFGGDNFTENVAVARKALDTFGTPELKEILDGSGFGNHPAVIRAFYKIGKAISEDGFVKGSAKGPETDVAKRMFPTMN